MNNLKSAMGLAAVVAMMSSDFGMYPRPVEREGLDLTSKLDKREQAEAKRQRKNAKRLQDLS